MTPQARNVALRLRLYRAMSGRTVVQIAMDLDVSCPAAYRYEHGAIIKLETVARIADLLGLTFEQVIAPVTEAEKIAAIEHLTPVLLQQTVAA